MGKVIILNGSPKANGNTATALHEVERTLGQQGIETEWIHVGHLQIHGCIACNKCWTSGICAFGDIVNEISVKMREADGLLIGSPVYFASPNGTLLSLLDRLVPSQYWSIAHGTAPGEVTQDEEGMQTMRQLGLNMAFLIKSIRLGLQQFGSPKIQEELTETHYIR